MAWIDVSSDEIPTTGDHAAKVAVSKGASSTLLFAKSGAKEVYQREGETVTEYRGLTEASAQAKTGVTDKTTQTAWYGTFGSEDHSIVATTGKRTVATAARANEARGWTLTVRETAYSTIPEDLTTEGWAKSRVDSEGNTRTVSKSKSISHARTYNGCSLFQTKTTEVAETYGLTKDAATAKVNGLTNASFKETTLWCVSGASKAWQIVQTGSMSYGSTRFVSDAEGWTATITTETYDWTQSGNTSATYWTVST